MRNYKKKLARVLVSAVAAAGCAASLQAETLTVQGIYAATVDLPGEVETIAVDRFAGRAGPDAQIAIMQALGGVALDGSRYFRVTQAGPGFLSDGFVVVGQPATNIQGENAADAVLTGTLRGDAFDRRAGFRSRKQCVARDQDGDCIKREDIQIPCFERTVQLNPRLILTSRDGTVLYANNEPVVEVLRFCRDDFFIPSPLEINATLVDQLALAIRLDLAPEARVEGVRVMERRKGLKGSDRDRFRDAVKLTNNDPYGACLAFQDLKTRNPDNVSVLFNNGLCAEVDNDLASARDYYRRALAVDPGRDYPSQGLARIASRERAAIQLAARGVSVSLGPAQ